MAKNLEKESSDKFINVNLRLNKSTINMVDRWYPVLKNKGMVENKTQTLTSLAILGELILENYKLGKAIYVGEDMNNLQKLNVVDKYNNPVIF